MFGVYPRRWSSVFGFDRFLAQGVCRRSSEKGLEIIPNFEGPMRGCWPKKDLNMAAKCLQ